MDRHRNLSTFPESSAQQWRRIEQTLSDLSTTIGLVTEWHQNVISSQSHEETAYSLHQIEYELRRIFDAEAEYWSEISISATSERQKADLKQVSEQRTTVLRQANGLRESSRFVASGSEWEELASSVEQLRISVAKYRSLASQFLRVLNENVPPDEEVEEHHQTGPRRRRKPR